MTREERCKYLLEKGYTYNKENGKIYNPLGNVVKNENEQGYNNISFRYQKKYYILKSHHFAWYFVYGNCDVIQIDHINGIKNDNRICNLRNVTHQQNQWNRTLAKGYYFDTPSNKWRATIRLNNKNIHLGYFTSERKARQSYLNAKQQYHVI